MLQAKNAVRHSMCFPDSQSLHSIFSVFVGQSDCNTQK